MFFQIQDISISFGGLRALSGVNLEVESGVIYSIIGPNGAGKTTIFNLISGIHRPDEGNILFKGGALIGLRPYQVAKRGIARTFQNIELFTHMTTMDNLMLGRHAHMSTGVVKGALLWGRRSGAAKEEIENRQRVEMIIDFLGLQSARDRLVNNLPYGTRKLVELGRALALEPALLLLDEPFAGMNLEEKQDLSFWIRDIKDDLGVTVILVEHDMNIVMDLSDRILVLDHGEVIAEGEPDDIRNNPRVIKAYLGEDQG